MKSHEPFQSYYLLTGQDWWIEAGRKIQFKYSSYLPDSFAQKSHAQNVGSDLTPVVSQLKHELMIVKHYLDE